jgi:hypothetical protein
MNKSMLALMWHQSQKVQRTKKNTKQSSNGEKQMHTRSCVHFFAEGKVQI